MEFRPILLSLKHNKMLSALIILQVTFTLAVVSNSLFVTTATLKEWNLPSGLDEGDIISVFPQFYDESVDTRQIVVDDLRAFRELPGVVEATTATQIPFAAEEVASIYLETGDEPQPYRTNIFDFDASGIEVLGLDVINGRSFYDADVVWHDPNSSGQRPAVVMISQSQANELFEDGLAVGKTLWLEPNAQPVQVIGVYSDFMNGESLNSEGMSFHSVIRPVVAIQRGQDPNYLIRTEPGQAESMFDSITDIIYSTPGRYLYVLERLTRTQKRMYDGRGSNAALMLTISLILVVITALGTAGLVSFLVNQRRKQIGIRRALGATRHDILRYFLLENAILTVTGLILGAALTLFITYVLTDNAGENLLQMKYLLLVAVGLLAVNLVSVYFPARRAARVDPAIVTRSA